MECSKRGLTNLFYRMNTLTIWHDGLIPYELDLTMFPQSVESGFIQRLFDLLCEGLEKSNHQTNRGFQTTTMRGGGEIIHKDSLFFESSFCFFLKFLRFAVEVENKGMEPEPTFNDKEIVETEQMQQ